MKFWKFIFWFFFFFNNWQQKIVKKTLILLSLVPKGVHHRIPEVEPLLQTRFDLDRTKSAYFSGHFHFPHPPTQSTLKQQSAFKRAIWHIYRDGIRCQKTQNPQIKSVRSEKRTVEIAPIWTPRIRPPFSFLKFSFFIPSKKELVIIRSLL